MANNRFRYPKNADYAPPLCRECPQYTLLQIIAHAIPEADTSITETDVSIVANRSCERGRQNDMQRACHLVLDPRSPLAQYLASQTGKNQI